MADGIQVKSTAEDRSGPKNDPHCLKQTYQEQELVLGQLTG